MVRIPVISGLTEHDFREALDSAYHNAALVVPSTPNVTLAPVDSLTDLQVKLAASEALRKALARGFALQGDRIEHQARVIASYEAQIEHLVGKLNPSRPKG